MSNQPNANVAPETPSPAPQAAQPAAGTEAAPQYVTLEQLAAAEERIVRASQSLVDKSSARVQEHIKAVEANIQTLKGMGVTLTDAQAEAWKNREAMAVLTGTAGSDAHAPASQTGQVVNGNEAAPGVSEPSNVDREAWQMMAQAGMYFEDGDPELGQIVTNSTPYQYLRSIEQALASKRARLGNVSAAPPPAVGRTPATISGGAAGATNPIANITDPRELFRIAQEQGKL